MPTKLIVYGDPEFAAFMWREVEDDPCNVDGDDVAVVDMRPGDVFTVEWLGFELVDSERVTHVKVMHETSAGQPVKMSYTGWVPHDKIKF